MRLSKVLAAGVIVASTWSEWSIGAPPPPPLDRPSPPPCCADGVCYPSATWGVYPTRWRRWPTEPGAALEPTPARPRPGELGPDVPPYTTPSPEEEDERAPPSTRRPEGVEAAEEGDDAAPGPGPMAPPGPGQMAPPPGTDRPRLNGPDSFEGPMESTPVMPWDEPTSDADPPPAPPFATAHPPQLAAPRTAARSHVVPASVQTALPARITNDPPPSLPLALGGGAQ